MESNVIVNQAIAVDASSSVSMGSLRVISFVVPVNCDSVMTIAGNFKWNRESDTDETWTEVEDTPGSWTPVPTYAESWTRV
jgi:hypothetical protein